MQAVSADAGIVRARVPAADRALAVTTDARVRAADRSREAAVAAILRQHRW